MQVTRQISINLTPPSSLFGLGLLEIHTVLRTRAGFLPNKVTWLKITVPVDLKLISCRTELVRTYSISSKILYTVTYLVTIHSYTVPRFVNGKYSIKCWLILSLYQIAHSGNKWMNQLYLVSGIVMTWHYLTHWPTNYNTTTRDTNDEGRKGCEECIQVQVRLWWGQINTKHIITEYPYDRLDRLS